MKMPEIQRQLVHHRNHKPQARNRSQSTRNADQLQPKAHVVEAVSALVEHVAKEQQGWDGVVDGPEDGHHEPSCEAAACVGLVQAQHDGVEAQAEAKAHHQLVGDALVLLLLLGTWGLVVVVVGAGEGTQAWGVSLSLLESLYYYLW